MSKKNHITSAVIGAVSSIATSATAVVAGTIGGPIAAVIAGVVAATSVVFFGGAAAGKIGAKAEVQSFATGFIGGLSLVFANATYDLNRNYINIPMQNQIATANQINTKALTKEVINHAHKVAQNIIISDNSKNACIAFQKDQNELIKTGKHSVNDNSLFNINCSKNTL
jgi:hypothetical protein